MESTLEGLQQQLQAPDAIMEPNILKLIATFVYHRGNPEEIVGLLSANYQGYAEMANTLSDWLVDTGLSKEEVSQLIYTHLQGLIHQYFSAERADTVLDHGSAPWVTEMIKYPTWRKLVYELIQTYPSSVLLNLAIKRICDAGFLDELALVPASAAQLEVFTAIVSHTINKLLTLSEDEFEKCLQDFCHIVCQAQHTYLLTQSLLNSVLQTHRHGLTIKRISQELQKSASATVPSAWIYNLLFNNSSTNALVLAALQPILTHNDFSPANILKLHELYTRPAPPPVDMLRSPALFDAFCEHLFVAPPKAAASEHVSRCAYLLAYAASVRDEVAGSGYVRTNTSELQNTLSAIETSLTVLHEVSLHPTAVSSLCDAARVPIAAQGILAWIKRVVCDPAFFSAFNAQIVPTHLALLEHIAATHELLQTAVLAVLRAMFTVSYDIEPVLMLDVRRMLLDRCLYLLSLGCALPVMDFVASLQPNDLSLVVYFITQAFSVCGAPYSPAWVASFMRVLARPSVQTGLRAKGPQMVDAIAMTCRDLRETPGISPALQQSIDVLRDECKKK
eukprot:m.5410 g.5410  ORF g.5410 m.5410 type:complete len:562 (-) comp4523_c0_seq1:47-1732(-)